MQKGEYRAVETQFEPGYSPSSLDATLLNKYSYLVKRAASHLRSLTGVLVDSDDLTQIGMLALMDCLNRYGSEPDEQFEGFAFMRVRGAMLDEFRRADWRPRGLRREAHDLRDLERKLSNKLGARPSEQMLCEELNISHAKLTELRYVLQAEAMDSLTELFDAQKETGLATTNMSRFELSLALQKAVSTLTDRHKLLLNLYYTQELNMKEVALVMNLTESRVCQLHRQAIEKLTYRLSQ